MSQDPTPDPHKDLKDWTTLLVNDRLKRAEAATEKLALEQNSFLRSAYTECGQWARHFSTVRMAVATFLIGLSLGITSFAWDKAEYNLVMLLATATWALMLVLFLVLTHYMWKWYAHQGRTRDELSNRAQMLLPGASDTKPVDAKRFHAIDWPTVAVVLLSVAFYAAQWSWFKNPPKKPVTRVEIVNDQPPETTPQTQPR